jgi:hypothetical protein
MSTNTYLVECSHNNAIVTSSDSNSLYTNRVADGIQLNVGDQVSVHSAYVHEIGSGSETIEFDGKAAGTHQVLETQTAATTIPATQQVVVGADASASDTTIFVTIPAGSPLIYYGSQVYTTTNGSLPQADNVRVSTTATDGNETTFVVLLTLDKALLDDLPTGTVITVVNSWLNTYPAYYTRELAQQHSYTMADNTANISYGYFKAGDGQNCMMLPRRMFASSTVHFPLDDFNRYDVGGNATDDGLPANFLIPSTTPPDSTTYFPQYRREHDGSRYKIFRMVDTVPPVSNKHSPVGNHMSLLQIDQLDVGRDIALRDFQEYRDRLELTVPTGYNTPANIAQDLTAQMQKCPALVSKTATVPNRALTMSKTMQLSVVAPSPTFKQFSCACVKNYNQTNYDTTINAEANSDLNFAKIRDYLLAHQHIGVYDPELFTAGRALPREGCIIRKNIGHLDRTTAEIVINMEYTEPNLLLWKAVFDAQAKRSDLIFGTGISTSNCRFIHMNTRNFIQVGANKTNFLYSRLGDDGMLDSPFAPQTGQSARQFVNYGDSDLAYGFAKSTAVQEYDYYDTGTASTITKTVNYITFKTNNVGGIQDQIQLPIVKRLLPPTTGGSDGSTYAGNLNNFSTHVNNVVSVYTGSIRFAGWDWHFSAYGNDAVVLWSGYVADGPVREFTPVSHGTNNYADYRNIVTDSFGVNETIANPLADTNIYPTYAYVDWITLGADNPLINFSSTGSRFTLSKLHTSPRQGNLPLAGRDSIITPQQTFPDDPDSKNPVYRINPILNRGNTGAGSFNYNPEVRQLPTFSNAGVNQARRSYDTILKRWTVFDSMTGIMIEDFGCDEASWSESLWFKLGFDYNQLNATSRDYQARATNANQQLVPVTTNADVNATQMLALMINIYGGAQYTLQSPIAGLSINEITTTGTTYLQEIIPEITEVQTSTVLTAARKPEKQVFGYYTIRSSLIDSSQYFSEDVMLPVISVLSKNYTGTDFVFGDDASDAFTVTKPTTVTAITTGIYMPDGKLARTDPRSCVIYKIKKAFNYNPNIVQELLAQQKAPRPTRPS